MVRWLVESETVHREDKELYEYAVYSLFFNSNTNSAYTDYR